MPRLQAEKHQQTVNFLDIIEHQEEERKNKNVY